MPHWRNATDGEPGLVADEIRAGTLDFLPERNRDLLLADAIAPGRGGEHRRAMGRPIRPCS